MQEARRHGIPCASALSGIYDLFDERLDYAALMDNWLRRVPEATLMMCHPGQPASTDHRSHHASHDHLVARVAEWQHLSSDLFAQQLQQHRVRWVRGASLYR